MRVGRNGDDSWLATSLQGRTHTTSFTSSLIRGDRKRMTDQVVFIVFYCLSVCVLCFLYLCVLFNGPTWSDDDDDRRVGRTTGPREKPSCLRFLFARSCRLILTLLFGPLFSSPAFIRLSRRQQSACKFLA